MRRAINDHAGARARRLPNLVVVFADEAARALHRRLCLACKAFCFGPCLSRHALDLWLCPPRRRPCRLCELPGRTPQSLRHLALAALWFAHAPSLTGARHLTWVSGARHVTRAPLRSLPALHLIGASRGPAGSVLLSQFSVLPTEGNRGARFSVIARAPSAGSGDIKPNISSAAE